jgi:UDP-N-acetylenolpyruvoylglucosamine reductase
MFFPRSGPNLKKPPYFNNQIVVCPFLWILIKGILLLTLYLLKESTTMRMKKVPPLIGFFLILLGSIISFKTTSLKAGEHSFKSGPNVNYLGIESYRQVKIYNWAQNVQFTPQIIFFPKSSKDLVNIVNDARTQNKRLTVIGKGHSWNPLMEGSDYLVSTLNLNQVWVDSENLKVTVEAGATIAQVDAIIEKQNLMVPCNIVGTTDITYGGIFATGSHGSGRTCPVMSDFIESIEIVKSDGTIELVSAETHGEELMSAIRLNLGLFGIMYKITFKVAKSFNALLEDKAIPREQLFTVLPKLLRSKDNVEVLWFPFTDQVVTKSWVYTGEGITEFGPWDRNVERLKKYALYELFKPFVSGIFEQYPQRIPLLLRTVSPYIFPDRIYVTDGNSAIHYINEGSKYPIQETEIAIPFDLTPSGEMDLKQIEKGWNAMVNSVFEHQKQGRYPLNVVVHMRFIAGSNVMMAPAFGNSATC